MTQLKEFLSNNQIPYNNIWVFISDKLKINGDLHKIPIGEKNNKSLKDVIRTNNNIIFDNEKPIKTKINNKEYILSKKEYESLFICHTLYLKYVENLYCIDIDDKTIKSLDDFNKITNIFKDCPWVAGNTKGIHIYVYIKDIPEYKNQQNAFKNFEGDFININNMWERIDKDINNNSYIPTLEYNNIKDIFKPNLFKQSDDVIKEPIILPDISVIYDTKNKIDLPNLKKYLNGLSTERSDNYSSWTKVVWGINNVCHSNNWSLKIRNELIHDFSKKSNKYNESEVDNFIVNNIKNINNFNGVGIGSIINWFKEDSNEITDLHTPLFTTGLIAEYFKQKYSDNFIVSDEILYFYNGIYWERDDKNHSYLNIFINSVFSKHLNEYAVKKLKDNLDDKSIDDDYKDEKQKKILTFLGEVNKIKNISTRTLIIKDIIIYLTKHDIEWNKNPYLFAFKNKIFDLKNNIEVTSDPLDYISITTGYDYKDDEPENKQKLYDNLINVAFKNPLIGQYYLSILSTGLLGIHMENFFVASGIGGNGKSVINGLMLKTLGNYAYVLPNTVLLSAIKEGGNPQVYGMNYKRFVLCQEPDSKKRICCATVKEITGSSTLNVRDNFQTSENCKITLNLTLLMECNEKPLLDETTQAMARRIRVVPFNSVGLDKSSFDKMSDQEVKDNNYFIMDSYYCSDEFKEKYRITFFNILRGFIKQFIDNKNELPEAPKECKVLTSSYMASSDDFFNWFCDKYEEDTTNKIYYTYNQIYTEFKESDYFYNLTKTDKRKFTMKFFYEMIDKNHFIKKYKKIANSYFNGNQIKSDYVIGWVLKKPEETTTTYPANNVQSKEPSILQTTPVKDQETVTPQK
jgi:phage/plasmid-associated DNA primase